MSWFRVDDQFPMHPKVVDAGNAAIGLWVRCGAWSSANDADGYVPRKVALSFGTRQEIDQLVASHMWVPSRAGYQLPDFLQFNPSGEQNKARKAQAAERQRRFRGGGPSLRAM
jgi:hypothetical protein